MATNLNIGCNGYDLSLLQDTTYRLSFSKLPHVAFYCQTVNIPPVNLGIAPHSSPLLDMKLPGEKPVYGDFSVTILADKLLETYSELYNWLHDLTVMNKAVDDSSFCSVTVSNRTFHFSNVFPTYIGGLQLTNTVPESSAVTFDANFVFNTMELKLFT